MLGLQHYTRRDLEAVRVSGQKLQIQVLGLVSIADDVPPELAQVTIDSLTVLGGLAGQYRSQSGLSWSDPLNNITPEGGHGL